MTTDELYRQASALESAGRLEEAEGLCRQIFAASPQHGGALLLMGVIAIKRGDLANAVPFVRGALRVQPQVALGWFYCGVMLTGLGQAEPALASYRRAVEIDPAMAEAHHHCGQVLLGLDRAAEALAAFDRAIALRPELLEAQGGRGAALARLGRHDEALAIFDGVLAKNPGLVWALNLRGKLHLDCERLDAALADYTHSLQLGATLDALTNRASIFRSQGKLDEALADIQHALEIDPNSSNALFVRGLLAADGQRFEDALGDFQRVVTLLPGYPAPLTKLGDTLHALDRFQEALTAFTRAIAADKSYAKAYFGRGHTWRRFFREGQALADFDRAEALDPSLAIEPGFRLHLSEMACDWKDRAARIDSYVQRIRNGEIVNPGSTLTICDDPELQLQAARNRAEPLVSEPLPRTTRPHDRLRIAYVSPDFTGHVLAWQTVELIEKHDRARFEVFGISLVDWPENPTQERLSKAFEHFIKAGAMDDRATAELIASLEIDIVVDLAGYTDLHKAKTFAYRPAPVAVNYLGYPGTLGSENIDYIVADAVTIPPENEQYFTERVVRLPDCYFPCDTTLPIVETVTRKEAGLPDNGFVFCVFNNAYKISPAVFDVWMRLLKAVDGSVLWLNLLSEDARANLRGEARQRGVPAERLIFIEREPERWRHFARLRFADLHLDCIPYNAHSTATDMLRAGVPVLTCQGRAFAGRVASSLLTCLGLPELIAHDLEEYERIALDLARSPERLAALRAKLKCNLETSPLFDMTRLARHIEAAYEMMWQRRDAPPQSFSVPRLL